jgi:hypothetical protein
VELGISFVWEDGYSPQAEEIPGVQDVVDWVEEVDCSMGQVQLWIARQDG